MKNVTEVEQETFEAVYTQLEGTVRQLEDGGLPLDESIRSQADSGKPTVVSEPDGPLAAGSAPDAPSSGAWRSSFRRAAARQNQRPRPPRVHREECELHLDPGGLGAGLRHLGQHLAAVEPEEDLDPAGEQRMGDATRLAVQPLTAGRAAASR